MGTFATNTTISKHEQVNFSISGSYGGYPSNPVILTIPQGMWADGTINFIYSSTLYINGVLYPTSGSIVNFNNLGSDSGQTVLSIHSAINNYDCVLFATIFKNTP